MRVRPGSHPLHLLEVEALALAAPHGGLHLDRSDRRGDATVLRIVRGGLDVLQREGRLSARQGYQVQTAERLRAIALVVEQVALRLNQDAPMVSGEQSHG